MYFLQSFLQTLTWWMILPLTLTLEFATLFNVITMPCNLVLNYFCRSQRLHCCVFNRSKVLKKKDSAEATSMCLTINCHFFFGHRLITQLCFWNFFTIFGTPPRTLIPPVQLMNKSVTSKLRKCWFFLFSCWWCHAISLGMWRWWCLCRSIESVFSVWSTTSA